MKQLIQTLYRDLEHNVIPLGEDKRPLETWERWESDRVPVEVLCRWSRGDFISKEGKPWRYNKPLNWAMLTGAKPWSQLSGVVVVDADDAAAAEIVKKTFPETHSLPTRRGEHFFFRHPGSRIGNTVKIGGANIDIRGDGGYVRIYGGEWTPDLLNSLPVFDPNWLPQKPQIKIDPEKIEAAKAAASYIDEKLKRLFAKRWLNRQQGAQGGRGADKYVFALAVKLLHGFCIDQDDAEELLFDWGTSPEQVDQHGCSYPWSEKEIHHKIKGAAKVDYPTPGNLLSAEWSKYMIDLDCSGII